MEIRKSKRGYQPLYSQVKEYLESQIVSGELSPGEPVPTVNELAERFDVSVITTNRALVELANDGLVTRVPGQGTFVSSKLKTVKRGQPDVDILIGVVAPQLSWPLTSDIINYIEKNARLQGCILLFRGSENTVEGEEKAISTVVEQGAKGLILFAVDNEDSPNRAIEELLKRDIPIVLVDRSFSEGNIPYVTSDNTGGGYLATRHLIQQGYERIGFVGGNYWGTSSLRDRFAGYQLALETYGRDYDPSMVFAEYGLRVPSIVEELKLFVTKQEPDALVCLNDRMAIDVMGAVERLGLRVPEDVGVVGFDNDEELFRGRRAVTSIAQMWDDIAANAIRILSSKIRGKPNTVSQLELPVELVVRESSLRNPSLELEDAYGK